MMEEYLKATGVLSLSLLAVSASFMFQPEKLWTAVFLLPLTLVLGFVAHISAEGFERASLAAAPTLVFGFVDPVVGAVAIIISVSSPLVSVFTGGDSFSDYFSAVSMPLLISGLVLGGAAYVAIDTSETLEERAVNLTSEKIGSQTTALIEESGFTERYRDSQIQVVRASSEASVALTGQYLRNTSLDREASAKVASALQDAQDEVPDRVSSRVSEESAQSAEIGPQIEQSMRKLLDGRMPMFAVPIVLGVVYATKPFVGLLVGMWGVIFGRLLPT